MGQPGLLQRRWSARRSQHYRRQTRGSSRAAATPDPRSQQQDAILPDRWPPTLSPDPGPAKLRMQHLGGSVSRGGWRRSKPERATTAGSPHHCAIAWGPSWCVTVAARRRGRRRREKGASREGKGGGDSGSDERETAAAERADEWGREGGGEEREGRLVRAAVQLE